MEYDGRDVPDVATVVADFNEGAQLIVTASMVSAGAPIKQIIRGHYGSFAFGNGDRFTGFDFVPETERVTKDPSIVAERIETGKVPDTVRTHVDNFIEAIRAGKSEMCHNLPDLGAAAVTLVNLGAQSYRNGKAYFLNPETREITDRDPGWAQRWEQMSKAGAKPFHVPGWEAGDRGSTQETLEQMKLGGPWVDGRPPEGRI